jgi:16S rRNA (uracil1498-N3)-methyltransferase
MELFYAPDILSTHCLPEEESAHCVRVLRHTAGDVLTVTDGLGMLYEARILNPHPKHCELEILSSSSQSKHHRGMVHIAIAPTKNIDRLEWALEKCTEIGADRFTPLLCRFSERKNLRQDRLEKVILSAAKQSLTAYLPALDPLTDCSDFIRSCSADYKFIAHCYKESERVLLRDAINTIRSNSDIENATFCVLIGPEGDFSPEEVQLALQNGFQPVLLGNARLRTETAGVVACHTIVCLND